MFRQKQHEALADIFRLFIRVEPTEEVEDADKQTTPIDYLSNQFQTYIKDNGTGFIKKIIKEKENREAAKEKLKEEKKKAKG